MSLVQLGVHQLGGIDHQLVVSKHVTLFTDSDSKTLEGGPEVKGRGGFPTSLLACPPVCFSCLFKAFAITYWTHECSLNNYIGCQINSGVYQCKLRTPEPRSE